MLKSKQGELLQLLASEQESPEQKAKTREELSQNILTMKNLLEKEKNLVENPAAANPQTLAKKPFTPQTAELLRKQKLDDELNQIAQTNSTGEENNIDGTDLSNVSNIPSGNSTVIEGTLDHLRQTAANMGFDGSMQAPPTHYPVRGGPRGGYRARARAVYPRGAPVWNPRGGARGAAAYYYRGAPPPRVLRGAVRGAMRSRNDMVIDNRTTAISITEPPPSLLNRTSVFAHFQVFFF